MDKIEYFYYDNDGKKVVINKTEFVQASPIIQTIPFYGEAKEIKIGVKTFVVFLTGIVYEKLICKEKEVRYQQVKFIKINDKDYFYIDSDDGGLFISKKCSLEKVISLLFDPPSVKIEKKPQITIAKSLEPYSDLIKQVMNKDEQFKLINVERTKCLFSNHLNAYLIEANELIKLERIFALDLQEIIYIVKYSMDYPLNKIGIIKPISTYSKCFMEENQYFREYNRKQNSISVFYKNNNLFDLSVKELIPCIRKVHPDEQFIFLDLRVENSVRILSNAGRILYAKENILVEMAHSVMEDGQRSYRMLHIDPYGKSKLRCYSIFDLVKNNFDNMDLYKLLNGKQKGKTKKIYYKTNNNLLQNKNN